MKIIRVDNFNRDNISDTLIATDVSDYYAPLIVSMLNEKLGGIHSPNFYRVVEDNHKPYGIQLDFDVEFEPPKVYIADRQGIGCCYVEVLEEPQLILGRLWSWNDKDWEVGETATKILKFMNSKDFDL